MGAPFLALVVEAEDALLGESIRGLDDGRNGKVERTSNRDGALTAEQLVNGLKSQGRGGVATAAPDV
ncbi:MAG: hypothetical protein IPI67_27300 [Myxococcales bacterium]|nr:hypothetical protein [Myxococcales bacterium]